MSRKLDPGERERKRLHVLEVAAEEFARLGFDRANINVIAERAGLGKGTIYLYAESKEQLFLDLLLEIGTQTRDALEESLASSAGASDAERLRRVAAAFQRLAEEHPDFARLQASTLFGVNRRFQSAAATILRGVVDDLARLFEGMCPERLAPEATPQMLGLVLLGSLQTLPLLSGALGIEADDGRSLVDVLVDLLATALAAQHPAQRLTALSSPLPD